MALWQELACFNGNVHQFTLFGLSIAANSPLRLAEGVTFVCTVAHVAMSHLCHTPDLCLPDGLSFANRLQTGRHSLPYLLLPLLLLLLLLTETLYMQGKQSGSPICTQLPY